MEVVSDMLLEGAGGGGVVIDRWMYWWSFDGLGIMIVRCMCRK